MITVSGKAMCTALAKVTRVKPYKVSPITEHLLVECSNNTLSLTATDIDTFITTEIVADCTSKDGKFLLPPRAISMLMLLKDEPAINIAYADQDVTIAYRENKLKCYTELPGNFPTVTNSNTVTTFQYDHKAFGKLLSTGKTFVSTDDLRPAMTGFYLTNNTLVATDAHRLLEVNNLNIEADKFSCILPATLATLFSVFENTITVTVRQETVSIQDSKTMIITKLIDARFPDYKVVIPDEMPLHIGMNKTELLANLRFALKVAGGSNRLVSFTFTGNEYQLYANDGSLFDEIKLNGKCFIERNDNHVQEFEIGLNVAYLLQLIVFVEGNDVIFELDKPNKAILLHSNNALMLLMPLMLPTQAEIEALKEQAAAMRNNTKATVTQEREEYTCPICDGEGQYRDEDDILVECECQKNNMEVAA